MSQTTNFQIRLTLDELQTLNSRAVLLTAAQKKPFSLQDVVRKWIEAGCPVDYTQPGDQPKPQKTSKNARRNKKS